MRQIYVKRTGESRMYGLDFVNFPEIQAGAHIASVVSFASVPTGLTLGPPTFSGTVAAARISGGSAPLLYRVLVTILTDAVPADTLVGVGYLQVNDR
jgi:hypothetical protein